MCLLPPALCAIRVWLFSFCHAVAMLPSPYPYPILVMLGGLSSLCGETLHGGTDLLCVCVWDAFCCLEQCSYTLAIATTRNSKMLLSPYPYAILVMCNGHASLCHGSLHSGTDLLCVLCAFCFLFSFWVCVHVVRAIWITTGMFLSLGSIPSLQPYCHHYAAFAPYP